MKNITRVVGLLALSFVLSAFKAGTSAAIDGNWIGEYTSINQSVPFRVHFWQENGVQKGAITLSDKGSKDLPLSWVVVESTRVHFELVRTSGTLVFDGVLRNGVISGDLLYSNLRGSFQLAPDDLVNL